MLKTISRFAISLIALLLVSFFIHGFIQTYLGYGFYSHGLLLMYIFNAVLTVLIFGTLIYFRQKRSDQLGFIFLFSSIAKLGLFFAFIYPNYKIENGFRSPEFAAFFVPYFLGLFFEVQQIIRLLNKE